MPTPSSTGSRATLAAVESKNGTAEQSRMKFLRWSAMRSSTVPTVEAALKKKARN